MNIKGLGNKQLEFIKRMASKNLVVRVYTDYYSKKTYAVLESLDSDKKHNRVNLDFLDSIYKRGLLDSTTWMPSIRLEVVTIFLLPKSKKKLKLK